MNSFIDGPAHSGFKPVSMDVDRPPVNLDSDHGDFVSSVLEIPSGEQVGWGIPFTIDRPILLLEKPVKVSFDAVASPWLVFLHVADLIPVTAKDGIISPMRGSGSLNRVAATYRIGFDDGTVVEEKIRLRHQIGTFSRRWGENCFEAVANSKPKPVRPHHEQLNSNWGQSQTRASASDQGEFIHWIWCWNNPRPDAKVTGVELIPGCTPVAVSAVTAGNVNHHPTRWLPRRSAVLNLDGLPDKGREFVAELDEKGQLSQVRIDLGQVISAQLRRLYPVDTWDTGYDSMPPELSNNELFLEYTAHPEAYFHLAGGKSVSLQDVSDTTGVVVGLEPERKTIRIRVVEKGTATPVPVKLHVHGEHGEYLAPVDRHRIPNGAWFEDYSVDFIHKPPSGETGPHGLPLGPHYCTYISGETTLSVPPGKLYVEVAKGYEIKPKRDVFDISGDTDEIVIEIDRVLHWREEGWASADTHVHFLSPISALMEGSAEGVNIVNLLASQWGELMTNVGDFDGKTTWGSKEAGGDGEYLVRVGTENRQHVLGHISLLGYDGNIIAPMTTGGPDESALGDPIGALLSEWAAQCKKQNGVVVIPQFPNPRAENAAVIVEDLADGVEMTSWGNIYGGLDPYSLSDWYRYLNCGYRVAAVGGTDKMSAQTPVGAVRTYARVEGDFTYESWKEAVRRGETFVTYGPLVTLNVDGTVIGGEVRLPRGGGTVTVGFRAASCTVPMVSAELVVNGRVREVRNLGEEERYDGEGEWDILLEGSAWCAVLIRGRVAEKEPMIAAHTSACFIICEDTPLYVEEDALTILEQIEGALAYIDTVGTRAETKRYKEMRIFLESAHRRLHNRMHRMGYFHEHTVSQGHPGH